MIDLSDWIWLIVVVLWMVARVLPRLFRSKAETPTPAKKSAPPQSSPKVEGFENDRLGDIGPKPIEPK